jgi:hypothetical protein
MIIQFRTFDGTVLKSINAVSADGPIEYGTTVPKIVRKAILSILQKANYSSSVDDELNTIAAWAADTTNIQSDTVAVAYNGRSSMQMSVTTTPSDEPVCWESTNPSIVSVTSAGLATAESNGVCTLIGRSGDKTISINAKVMNVT